MSEATDTPALADLMEHEKVIEQGLATFIEVGWALLQIRDGKKYRAAGFDTFEHYCLSRWSLGKSHANRLMNAAEITQELETSPIGEVSPTHESQVRPLAALPDTDTRAEVWDEAVEQAGGGQPTAKQVERAVEKRKPQPLPKPDLGNGVSHPARYSDELLPVFAELLKGCRTVLDPFAGTGRIHELRPDFETTGVEIEPEWAEMSPHTVIGNALALDFPDETFDAICTSPTYGNRLADHHDASDPESRRSYTHDLGRSLHEANSGAMQWGDAYRAFHEAAWHEAVRVLAEGGVFVLNVKDHIRDGRWQDVVGWHIYALCDLGLYVEACRPVVTSSLRQGTNTEARVGAEMVLKFGKGST